MEDLNDYRSAVQANFPRLDVLYRGMEFFGARPYVARQAIAKELVGCDLLLGIVAHLHGSCDPKTGVSYCETEYQLANRNKIPAIFFLMNDSQRVHPAHVERNEDNARKLNQFKETIKRETVHQYFTTPDDLVIKVIDSLRKWLAETDWHRLKRAPLSPDENGYVRQLHSSDSKQVKHGITRLSRSDCHPAFENLYARLHRTDLDSDTVQDLFEEFKFFRDDDRASQMLLNLMEDVPEYRYFAIMAIGERARSGERHVTPAEVERVIQFRGDDAPAVRREVAHALWKFGVRYPDRIGEFLDYLRVLKQDPEKSVREKASVSEQRMPPRQRAAGKGH